jgi:hypothetical protein
MCMPHVLGEHAETHMFLTKMLKHHSLQGFRDGSMFFGAAYVLARHERIIERLPGHKTPLFIPKDLYEKYPFYPPTERDYIKSNNDLLTRCAECRLLQVKHQLRLQKERGAEPSLHNALIAVKGLSGGQNIPD